MYNKYILGAAATNDRFWAYISPVDKPICLDGIIEQNYIRLHKNDTAHNIFNGMEAVIALRESQATNKLFSDE